MKLLNILKLIDLKSVHPMAALRTAISLSRFI